jgi:hypothetical protein
MAQAALPQRILGARPIGRSLLRMHIAIYSFRILKGHRLSN